MQEILITINNLSELAAWSQEFTKTYLSRYKKILFYGNMGVGKTTFIKMLCRELGVKESTSSPTFALVHQYEGSNGKKIHHADLYRLHQAQEAIDIGIEDLFFDDNYLFIEWPEQIEDLAPDSNLLRIYIDTNEEEQRFFKLLITE